MDFEVCNNAIIFIETDEIFAKELGILARNILLKEPLFILSEECKKKSIDGRILKDLKDSEFIDTEVFHFFFVLDFLIGESEKLKTPGEWYNFILNINKPQFNLHYKRIGHKFINLSIIIANRYFNVNIPQLIIQNVESNSILIKHSYFDIFPFITSSNEDLIDALFITAEDITAQDNYFNLNDSVKEKSSKSIDFGYSLINKSTANIEKAKLFIPHAFIGITNAVGLIKSFSISEELLKSSNKELIKIGLRCISMLNGINDKPEIFEMTLLPILENIESTDDDDLLSQLIFLYGLLIDKLKISKQKLVDIPNKYSGKNMFFALATILHIKIKEELYEPWVTNSLLKLSNLNSHHIGTFNAVNRVLHQIIELNTDIIYNYFCNFINEQQNSIDDLQAFNDLFSELREIKFEVYTQWLVFWFNNNEYRYHRAAAKTLMMIHTQSPREIILNEIELNKLNPYDVEFILYKIVGNVFSKEHLQSLVYSVLLYQGEIEFIRRIVAELFCYYITYNYPGSLDYLKQKKASSNIVQKEVIEDIEQYFEEVYSIRKEKPKELNPSHERLQLLFNQTTKQFNTLEDKSKFRQTSILDLVTKVSIKTGNAFFSRDESFYGMKNRYTNKSTMGHISNSFDFPSGEFLDPIGQEYNRYIWRTFKRRHQ